MSRLILTASLLAALSLAGSASAASAATVKPVAATGGKAAPTSKMMPATMTDTGLIQSMNPARHTVTLDDGKTFSVPSRWKFGSFRKGERVVVSYKTNGTTLSATRLTAAK